MGPDLNSRKKLLETVCEFYNFINSIQMQYNSIFASLNKNTHRKGQRLQPY